MYSEFLSEKPKNDLLEQILKKMSNEMTFWDGGFTVFFCAVVNG